MKGTFVRLAPKGLLGALLVSLMAACSAAPEVTAGASSSAVIKGTASDPSQNAVVLLVMIDRGEGGIGQCTGTMLAPNLVLTARHCVSATEDGGIACRPDGTPLGGGGIRKDKAPADIYVVVGDKRPTRPEANGQGAKLIHNGARNLCNNDIALVLLKEPIKDVPIAPIRLDSPAVVGELITAIGWGVSDKSQSPSVRQQRTGIEITASGSDNEERTGPAEFAVGESICSGDSGGPAIAETTGAVLGVVSRGGNGTQPTNNPATSCIGASTSNFYTDVSSFKDMILAAYEEAGQEPWLEGGPDPRLTKDGEACTESPGCRSNACIAGKCVPSCAKAACAAGTTCQDKEGAKVCLAPPAAPPGANNGGTTTTTTGCASTGAPLDASWLVGAFGVAAMLVSRRRKKA